MECPRCGFNSLPGTTACLQCRADLTAPAPAAPSDFLPERTARGSFRAGLSRSRARERANLVGIQLPRLASHDGAVRAMLASLVVPGLGQRRNGQASKAWVHVVGWLALLVLNALAWTSAASPAFVGALLAWTGASMVDAYAGAVSLATGRGPFDRPRLLVGASLLAAALVTALPMAYSLGTALLFDRIRVNYDLPGLRVDEVALLLRGDLELERGQVALTRWTPERHALAGAKLPPIGQGGTYPELVVGLPGETLEVVRGTLFANGEPVMSLDRLPAGQRDLRHDVPPGSHVSIRWTIGAGSDPLLVELPAAATEGRVWAISWPPERRRILRDLTVSDGSRRTR